MGEEEAGFLIDGEAVAFPVLGTLDLDEDCLLMDETGWSRLDFVMDPTDAEEAGKVVERLLHPKTRRALAAISYMRAHPDVDTTKAVKLAGKANATGSLVELLRVDGDAENPKGEDTTSEPSSSSASENGGSSLSSGEGSQTSSDHQETVLPITGMPVLGTSFPPTLAATLAS